MRGQGIIPDGTPRHTVDHQLNQFPNSFNPTHQHGLHTLNLSNLNPPLFFVQSFPISSSKYLEADLGRTQTHPICNRPAFPLHFCLILLTTDITIMT